jgi:hypothetical protein
MEKFFHNDKLIFVMTVIVTILIIAPSAIPLKLNKKEVEIKSLENFDNTNSETIDVGQVAVEWQGLFGQIMINDGLKKYLEVNKTLFGEKVYFEFRVEYRGEFIGGWFPGITRVLYFSMVCKLDDGKVVSDNNQVHLTDKGPDEMTVIVKCDFDSEKNETRIIECCIWITACIEIFKLLRDIPWFILPVGRWSKYCTNKVNIYHL